MNNYNLRYNFIDICTPDYLTDHHNREGEQLITVEYYDSMSSRELAQLVASEVLGGSGYEELWAILPSNDEDAAVLLEQLVIDEVADWQLKYGTLMSEGDNVWYVNDSEVLVYGYFSWDIL